MLQDDGQSFGRNNAHALASKKGAEGKDDAEGGEEEGVFLAEYNRWLALEKNWESAEATRSMYMEGSQKRKSRDERHRERGMERQAASIEQMKAAKGKVEEHREKNLNDGKVRWRRVSRRALTASSA